MVHAWRFRHSPSVTQSCTVGHGPAMHCVWAAPEARSYEPQHTRPLPGQSLCCSQWNVPKPAGQLAVAPGLHS